MLFRDEDRFDDAHNHIDRAKSYAIGNTRYLARLMDMNARIWHQQRRLEDAASEAQGALEIFEELEAIEDVTRCETTLRLIEQAMAGEPLKIPLPAINFNSASSERGAPSSA